MQHKGLKSWQCGCKRCMPKDLPTIKETWKPIFRSTKAKHVQKNKFYMHLTYHMALTKHLFFSAHWHCCEGTNINEQNHVISPSPLQEMKFLPNYRDIICFGENVLMNGGTMIIALLKYGMRLDTMKLRNSNNFITQEMKQHSLLRAILWFLLRVNSFFLTLAIQWIWNDKNQMNGVSVQKKGWD